MEHHDVVIIGAGMGGLCAAHTFLAISPSLSVVVLDSGHSIGGVWALKRVYPHLQTNNLQGYYEFTDFSMIDAGVGVQPRGRITGEAMHNYLVKYAQKFDLVQQIRLRTRVVRACEDAEKGWTVDLEIEEGDASRTQRRLTCGKLVMATDQTSAPYIPEIEGMASFAKPALHSVSLGREAEKLLNDANVKAVTVVGGSKSAHDAVYLFAVNGKQVTWIIHPPSIGRSAVPMAKMFTRIGVWDVWLESLFMLRPIIWFCAAPWNEGDGFEWIRRFLHNTSLGQKIVQGFFANASQSSAQESGVLRDAKTRALLPPASIMWYGTQSNALNYDSDFYELIASDNVSIVFGDIERLGNGTVFVSDHEPISTDALVLGTGYDWSSCVPLEPAVKRKDWGIPVDPITDTRYQSLDVQSDELLRGQFPLLRSSPSKPERRPLLTPWRLWRFLAPPAQISSVSQRNLVFLNTIASFQTPIGREVTSLWAYAYLHNCLAVQSPEENEVRKEISLWTRFGKWCAPYGGQGKFADLTIDVIPYLDVLLRDLGLRSWRKGCGWFGEVFGGSLKTEDYKGLVQEWLNTQRGLSANSGKKGQ